MAIKTFYPEDTESTLYLDNSKSLSEIIDIVKHKWPDCDFCDIDINPEYIHTDCIGYDMYDAGDYTNFIVITNTKI